MKTPLTFIEIISNTGRVSSLSFGGNRDNGFLRVVGGFEHGDSIRPKDKNERNKLVNWLNSIEFEKEG